MLYRYAPIVLAAAAVAGGNFFLWLNRPTARPVAPATLFNDAQPPVTAPATGPQPYPTTHRNPADEAKTRSRNAIRKPLDLNLHDEAQEADYQDNPVTQVPPIPLDLIPESPTSDQHWIDDDLGLFNTRRGVRGLTHGLWLSDSVRLRGGIGYSRDEQNQAYEGAIGLGVDLVF